MRTLLSFGMWRALTISAISTAWADCRFNEAESLNAKITSRVIIASRRECRVAGHKAAVHLPRPVGQLIATSRKSFANSTGCLAWAMDRMPNRMIGGGPNPTR